MSGTAREVDLKRAAAEAFDLAVVGGGITGAGVAREASLRGFSTCLVEARDFASGTSSRSTRDAYAHLADKRRAELEKTLRLHGIDSIELRTDSDYIPALRAFFRTRERRLARL